MHAKVIFEPGDFFFQVLDEAATLRAEVKHVCHGAR
jgi:hypothetical protein